MTKAIQITLIISLLGMFSLPLSADTPDGKTLFKNNCKACHNLDMRLVGPPLKGITDRKPEEWLLKFVKSSQTVIQSGDEYANALFLEYNQVPMPDQNLTEAEIKSIFAYIKTESEPKAEEEKGAITRPNAPPKKQLTPLQFGDITFWLPYTVTVLLIIGFLYHLTEVTTLLEEKAEE